MVNHLLLVHITWLVILGFSSVGVKGSCRTFCGNISVDYPLGIQEGCGHPNFRDLMYCINNVMMMRVASGGYQVVDIDYAFRVITVFDPQMSTCHTVGKGSDGFMLENQQLQHLQPTKDTAFMLLGCQQDSPLFQGFTDRHLPCKNVSGMGCEEYYECPSWVGNGARSKLTKPPPCCSLLFSDVGNLNLTRLKCYSYVATYASAPVLVRRPMDWNYGVQLNFFMPQDQDFCRSCKASKGDCGYDVAKGANLCLCGDRNSTSTCDPEDQSSFGFNWKPNLLVSSLFFGGSWMLSYILMA